MIVDSREFTVIDKIEATLLQAAPERFIKALSPSKLLKVHYRCNDESLIRLDIYNSTMYSTGAGTYHNFLIENRIQPKQFSDVPAFTCPNLSIMARIDMKLVAYVEMGQRKDFKDIFFALWEVELDESAGFPWYERRHYLQATSVSDDLNLFADGYRTKADMNADMKANIANFVRGLKFLKSIESNTHKGQ
jgi:hypothetical protein